MTLAGRKILLIVSGSVAAYKALELIRLLRKQGAEVAPILTAGGARFVTKEALAGISGSRVHDDLWAAEAEIGHIRLARLPDLVVVAPASADLLAKMAHGLADDLASTVLLATRAPILVAPAMNPAMWEHPATQANSAAPQLRGVRMVGPKSGAMSTCGIMAQKSVLTPPCSLRRTTKATSSSCTPGSIGGGANAASFSR